MLPNPLHPSVVHFPIVFMALLPIIAAFVMWRLHDGARLRAWGYVALTAALVVGSGWLATRTGENEEDTVERVVAEDAIHAHEEAAETFLLAAWVVLGLAVVGFAPGLVGRGARWLAFLGSVALVGLGWRVGDLGGKLVYEHGAASAYAQPAAGGAQAVGAEEDREDDGR
ncbi:MAG: hypothetical protein OER21_13175 [Gemmatimonadota bacterium]|nr:hypothetical protein [Gemmatimonadota bacterium]